LVFFALWLSFHVLFVPFASIKLAVYYYEPGPITHANMELMKVEKLTHVDKIGTSISHAKIDR